MQYKIKKFNAAQLYEIAYYHNQQIDHKFIIFLENIIKTYSIGNIILDSACGTGFPGLYLNKNFIITLSDISKDMLNIAKQKAFAMNLNNISFILSPWQKLEKKISYKFDTIICSGNALSILTNELEIIKSIRNFYKILNKNGLLYIDFRDDLISNSEFNIAEITKPVLFFNLNLFFIIYERINKNSLERLKICYEITKYKNIKKIGAVLNCYNIFLNDRIKPILISEGFSDLKFIMRPGNWPMKAIIGRKKIL